jgi:hypothetical protein
MTIPLQQASFWDWYYTGLVRYEAKFLPREMRDEDLEDDEDEVEERLVTHIFGHGERLDAVWGDERRQTLDIPFASGHVWRIELSRDPDEPGSFHYLVDSSGREPLPLGAHDLGDGGAPDLRWEELEHLVRSVDAAWSGSFPKAFVPLLLYLPLTAGSADDMKAIRASMARAFEESGVFAAAAARSLSRALLVKKAKWSKHAELGWITSAPSSPRNPKVKARVAKAWKEQDGFARFRAFMSAG